MLDVNYGGSTGHGCAYRERLKGNWGVVDATDCANGALHLVAMGIGTGSGWRSAAAVPFGKRRRDESFLEQGPKQRDRRPARGPDESLHDPPPVQGTRRGDAGAVEKGGGVGITDETEIRIRATEASEVVLFDIG